MISFTVNHPPVAQPRQKHRASKNGGAMNYVEKTHPVHAFKDAVHLASAGAVLKLMARGGMLLGPVVVVLQFILPRPKSFRKGGRLPHPVKPDCDNLAKAVLDALNERVWKDDSQVVGLTVVKLYAATGEEPHVDVQVKPYEEPVKCG